MSEGASVGFAGFLVRDNEVPSMSSIVQWGKNISQNVCHDVGWDCMEMVVVVGEFQESGMG